MKRLISIFAIITVFCSIVSAQSTLNIFRIMNVTPGCVKISGKVVVRYDYFNETEKIEWLNDNANMVVKPLNDYMDKASNQCLWYKGITVKVSASDKYNPEKPNLFWWIKYNRTSTKGNIGELFVGEYDMYGDELIVELPQVLKDGQGYGFVSLENEKSFFCEKDDKKPLIRITREMLNSIGFNGDSIALKVYYYNYKNDPELISDSMIIKYYK